MGGWIKKMKNLQIDPLRSGTSACSHTSGRDARKTMAQTTSLRVFWGFLTRPKKARAATPCGVPALDVET